MVEIREVESLNETQVADLADMLVRIVKSGASVGWLDTPDPVAARHYWLSVIRPDNVLLIAEENGHVVGTVQLELAQKDNAQHRAEVNKVLVRPERQGEGLGKRLMEAVEQAARRRERKLLHLDTDQTDISNAFYLRCGYTPIGTIPNWARSGRDGQLHGTTFYYKLLTEQ